MAVGSQSEDLGAGVAVQDGSLRLYGCGCPTSPPRYSYDNRLWVSHQQVSWVPLVAEVELTRCSQIRVGVGVFDGAGVLAGQDSPELGTADAWA